MRCANHSPQGTAELIHARAAPLFASTTTEGAHPLHAVLLCASAEFERPEDFGLRVRHIYRLINTTGAWHTLNALDGHPMGWIEALNAQQASDAHNALCSPQIAFFALQATKELAREDTLDTLRRVVSSAPGPRSATQSMHPRHLH